MKIGSLVVCVDDKGIKDNLKGLTKGKIYTIRGIESLIGGLAVLLEEVTNSKRQYADGISEPCYKIERFRELDTPTSISIEEIITQEA